MTRNEAFVLCLEKVKEKAPKGTWASYVHRHKNGKLSDKIVNRLLTENGFILIQREEWGSAKNWGIVNE